MTSLKEQNEPEVPPAFVVIVSGTEGEYSAANGSYVARAMWEGLPAYFHTENSEASIRWYGKKSAWVIMMKDGPRFASGGVAGDPSMCKNKELKVRIASKEELEDVEFAETLATQNDKEEQGELKSTDGSMANAYADVMKQADQDMSKSKKRRNRKKKQRMKEDKKKSSTQKLQASITCKPARQVPQQNPRCFVCLTRHEFGKCPGMSK